MVTFLGVRIPIVGHVGLTNRCSFLIVGRLERARAGSVPRPRVHGEPWCAGDGRPSSWGPNGHKPWPTIFANGALAPLVTSFVASMSFCRFVDATKAHDMTLAGGASFNGGIFLAATMVDKALKGSMSGEKMNKSCGREVREKETSRGI
jgi:hypothetical protein